MSLGLRLSGADAGAVVELAAVTEVAAEVEEESELPQAAVRKASARNSTLVCIIPFCGDISNDSHRRDTLWMSTEKESDASIRAL